MNCDKITVLTFLISAVFLALCGLILVISNTGSKISSTIEPAVTSLKSGNIHKTILEAKKTLKSVHHVSESIDLKQVVNQWKQSNQIIQKANIPWKEIPEWRLLAQHTLRSINSHLKKHPDMLLNLKDTSGNILETVKPVVKESGEWRRSLRGAAVAVAKTILETYENDEKHLKLS